MSRADRNWNPKYLKQEKERIGSSPEKFLGRWLTKARYEARKGIKDKIAADVTKEYLMSLYKRQNGKCAVSNKPLTHIVGSGKKEPGNISVARKTTEKPFEKGNIRLIRHEIHRD